jgi:alpha-D-ribose 1-methylphosphonate 5-triphosphate synthase subunit PhnI
MPPRPALLPVILVIMLSSATRAFGTTFSIVRRAPRASFGVIRSMSTTDEPTSIVATCQEKIRAALEADNVKVTGVLQYAGL